MPLSTSFHLGDALQADLYCDISNALDDTDISFT